MGKGRLRAGPFLFGSCRNESSANFFATQGLIFRYRGILQDFVQGGQRNERFNSGFTYWNLPVRDPHLA